MTALDIVSLSGWLVFAVIAIFGLSALLRRIRRPRKNGFPRGSRLEHADRLTETEQFHRDSYLSKHYPGGVWGPEA